MKQLTVLIYSVFIIFSADTQNTNTKRERLILEMTKIINYFFNHNQDSDDTTTEKTFLNIILNHPNEYKGVPYKEYSHHTTTEKRSANNAFQRHFQFRNNHTLANIPIKSQVNKYKKSKAQNYDYRQKKKRPDSVEGRYSDISCYDEIIKNDLPYVSETIFREYEGSIFFIETSCKGGLDMRETCSVESAAKAHPHRNIIVLFLGPVPITTPYRSMQALDGLNNVYFYRVKIHEFINNSPLQLLVQKIMTQSFFPVHHIANVMKFLILYKFGGVALDLDVIVLKSFDSLPEPNNWIGVESYKDKEIGTGLVAISKDSPGKRFIKAIITKMRDSTLELWRENLNGVVAQALEDICGRFLMKRLFRGVSVFCKGVAVYEKSIFYPIYYTEARSYFNITFDMNKLKNSFALHMYRSVTDQMKITEESAYSKLMKMFCPSLWGLNYKIQ